MNCHQLTKNAHRHIPHLVERIALFILFTRVLRLNHFERRPWGVAGNEVPSPPFDGDDDSIFATHCFIVMPTLLFRQVALYCLLWNIFGGAPYGQRN
jgi:hypothetical protein